MGSRLLILLVMLTVELAGSAVAQPSIAPTTEASQAPSTHPKEFWKQIVAKDFAVPEGEAAAVLVPELLAMLGSPDPELRDELGYATLAVWVYRDARLTPNELEVLAQKLRDNLVLGIGEQDTDSVLLRSFSALTLAVLVAQDARTPFLDAAELSGLLEAVVRYAGSERDLRGYVAGKGWVHAGAHTADLLRALALHPRLDVAGMVRVLAAIGELTNNGGGVTFSHGEDERLARAAVVAVRRDLIPVAEVRFFLNRLTRVERQVWQAYQATNRLDQVTYAGSRNGRNLMLNMLFLMGLDATPSQPYKDATAAVRAALTTLEPH